MMSMDEYYNKLVTKAEEKKILRKINFELLLNITFLVLLSLTIVISSYALALAMLKKMESNVFIIISFSLMLLLLVILITIDKSDAFKRYIFNDKIFILIYLSRKELKKLQNNILFKRLLLIRLRMLLSKISYKLWEIENNFKNLFVFSQLNEEVKIVDDLRRIFSTKIRIFLNNGQYEKINQLLNKLVELYSRKVLTDFMLNEKVTEELAVTQDYILDRYNQLNFMIDEINKVDISEFQKPSFSLVNIISRRSISILGGIILTIVGIIVIILVARSPNKYSYLLGILSMIISLCSLVYKLIFQKNSNNDKN